MTTATATKRVPAKAGPYGVRLWRRGRWVNAITDEGRRAMEAELARWSGNPLNVLGRAADPYARLLLRHGYDADDLRSLAAEGWVRAAYAFDPDRGVRLATLAYHAVKSALYAACRKVDRSMCRAVIPVSLDRLLGDDGAAAADLLADPRAADPADATDAADLAAVLEVLKPRERYVIDRRFGLGGAEVGTTEEVGRAIGYSHAYIGEAQRRAVEKLRRAVLYGRATATPPEPVSRDTVLAAVRRGARSTRMIVRMTGLHKETVKTTTAHLIGTGEVVRTGAGKGTRYAPGPGVPPARGRMGA